jgi:ribosomal protein S8E
MVRVRSRMRRGHGNSSRTFRGRRKTTSKREPRRTRIRRKTHSEPENLRMFLVHHITVNQRNEPSGTHRSLLRSHQLLKTQRVLL